MKRLAPWAWLVVLGTALALSWWSLDVLALRFGMPKTLAAMVSATFDGAALVAADLALRRAAVADSTAAVKLLMLVAVGLAAWLNEQHAALLGYPLAARVLFAAPSVISGWLFELQLRSLRRDRVHELGRAAPPLPQFGVVVWVFHPLAALWHVSRIAGSRLRSVPVTVMDWDGAVTSARALPAVPGVVVDEPVIVVAPIDVDEDEASKPQANAPEGQGAGDTEQEEHAGRLRPPARAERSPVPDELYLAALRKLVEGNDDVIPSAREVARKLLIGQDRARRLLAALKEEHADKVKLETTG